jgi:hypothetical protein
MPVLAAPFGIVSVRSTRAGGLIAGFAVLMVFQKAIEFGKEVATVTESRSGPFLWGAFLAFATAAIWLLIAAARTPGNTPFHRFEGWLAGVLRWASTGHRKSNESFDANQSDAAARGAINDFLQRPRP